MFAKIHYYLKSFLFLELLKGMSVTGRYFFRKKFTIQYPEEKTPISPRFPPNRPRRIQPATSRT